MGKLALLALLAALFFGVPLALGGVDGHVLAMSLERFMLDTLAFWSEAIRYIVSQFIPSG